MKNLKPFYQNNKEFEIHPWGKSENFKYENSKKDLFDLLGNDENLKHCSEMKIKSKEEIDEFINYLEIGFQVNKRHTYFISRISTNSLIGEVLLLPPQVVKDEYNINDTWMIQYLLDKKYWDHGIMTTILDMIFNQLTGKIDRIGAISHRGNIASLKILEKFNFKRIKDIGSNQDYFELILSKSE